MFVGNSIYEPCRAPFGEMPRDGETDTRQVCGGELESVLDPPYGPVRSYVHVCGSCGKRYLHPRLSAEGQKHVNELAAKLRGSLDQILDKGKAGIGHSIR